MPHAAVSMTERALAFTLGLFLLLPLYRGGNVVVVIQAAAIWSVLLVALSSFYLWVRRDVRIGYAGAMLFVALLLLLIHGLVSLFTVSGQTWLSLAGRDFYQPIVAANLSVLPQRNEFALSLDPLATKRAILSIVACIGPALACVILRIERLKLVLLAMAVLTIGEAILGLLQLALQTPSMLGYEQAIGGSRATGTFINKNHFASMLAMMLPLLLLRATGRFSFVAAEPPTSLSNVWWGIASAVVAAALISSVSRTGVATAATVSIVILGLCAVRERTTQGRVALVAIILFALLLGSMAGLSQFMDSISGESFASGAADRHLLTETVFGVARQFLPWGTGLGSFAIAFQRFQTPQLLGFIEYAHNDYAQLIFETGVVGLIFLVLLLLAALMGMYQLYRAYKYTRMLSPALACYLGVAAFAMHAWFDFPAHIPANAVMATMLFAMAINPDWRRMSQLARHSKLGHRTRPGRITIVGSGEGGLDNRAES
jgi:O-antigen ligase